MFDRLQAKFSGYRKRLAAFKERYGRYFPIAAFLTGFIYDNLTLTRIDRLIDNLVLLGYILLAGALLVLIGRIKTGQLTHPLILRYANWYPNILQFLLGGMFSAYVIYYFKSAAFNKSWLFVLLLIGLFLANEFLHDKLQNIIFLCTVYFFACFTFLTFFIPILTRSMTRATFFSSGAIGFVITGALITTIYKKIYQQAPRKIWGSALPMLAVFGVLTFFYLTNTIPPVPLSFKEGGIYHHVHKQQDLYELRFYRRAFFQFWVRNDSHYRYAEGDTVFCFASVFAPVQLRTRILHHWQFRAPGRKAYQTTDRLSYAISGGRDGGYRGYTFKRNVQPGDWRVDIETELGQVVGRINFTVENDSGVAQTRGKEIVLLR